jgi:hypothetical protein
MKWHDRWAFGFSILGVALLVAIANLINVLFFLD